MDSSNRNIVFSMIAGLVFSCGWWVFIGFWDKQMNHLEVSVSNVTLRGEIQSEFYNPLWAISSMATIGLFIINTVGNSVVQGDGFGADGQTCLARVYIFVGFMCLFSTTIASIWVMAANFAPADSKVKPYKQPSLGYALMVQNLLIFMSACIFKFFRVESAWGGF